MKIDVDVDQLRESLLDRAGSAAGVGFPAAMLDAVDIEDESPQELLARAEREGLDLRVFATGDDTDDAGSHSHPSTLSPPITCGEIGTV